MRLALIAGLLAAAPGARAAESIVPALAFPAQASSTLAPSDGAVSATTVTDADRLARAEAEIAALKHARLVERAKPKWWEFGCMGCLSITTALLILGALAL